MNILITGASTGIGWDLVDTLSNKGHVVFAGVRNKNDFDKINNLAKNNIHPLFLDVTKIDEIKNSFNIIKEILNGQYIDVLINNAGIVVSGPLETIPLDLVKNQFDVNVIGLIQMIQT